MEDDERPRFYWARWPGAQGWVVATGCARRADHVRLGGGEDIHFGRFAQIEPMTSAPPRIELKPGEG